MVLCVVVVWCGVVACPLYALSSVRVRQWQYWLREGRGSEWYRSGQGRPGKRKGEREVRSEYVLERKSIALLNMNLVKEVVREDERDVKEQDRNRTREKRGENDTLDQIEKDLV